MNVVVLCGSLSSDPVVRTLASGSVVMSLELSTPTAEGQASVPVAWFDPPPSASFAADGEVVVVGAVRRRFFRVGGVTQSRTEVVATEVVAVSKRKQVQRAIDRAAAVLAGG